MTKRGGTRVHVALLRGINVSGKNKLPMEELARMFEHAGCRDVETYIQSGNVVFAASLATVRKAKKLVQWSIHEAYGYSVPVIVRSGAELKEAFEDNPFSERGADPKTLHVAFLDTKPGAARVTALDPDRSSPDRFVLRGSEVYLCCPNGLGRSKLTNAYFDSKLHTKSTIRNWKTVTRLVEMVDR